MRIGNDHNGDMDGTITSISTVELDLLIKAIKLAENEPMCGLHEDVIGELGRQFSAMLQEMSKIS